MTAPSPFLKRQGASVLVTDWALSQYLIYNLLPIEEIVRVKNNEHLFVHHDPEHAADALAMQFPTTESAGYAEAGRLLQKVVKGFCSASPEARRAIMAFQDGGLVALKRFHRPAPARR